jgi:hypothetical protein
MKNDILGPWVVDVDDIYTLENLGQVLINFSSEGILRYSIFNEDKEDIILMTYKIFNEIIETSQPSNPESINRTKYILDDNKLHLYFDGKLSKFVRLI